MGSRGWMATESIKAFKEPWACCSGLEGKALPA